MHMEANVSAGPPNTHDGLRYEELGARDVLAPARGIVIGIVLSGVVWALVAFLAMHS